MAEFTTRSIKNGRTVLKDAVPVDTPFLLGFFLGDICNFKCKYCIQSASEETPEKKLLVRNFMTWDIFCKAAHQAKMFPQKIKKILLTSIGEPLLNPNIAKMVKYLRDNDVSDEIEIVSNASMLSHEMSDSLIDAGLSRLCISLQGLTSEVYKEVCGVEIDYDVLFDNLKYFYEHSRGKCKLHIKTVDIALKEGEREIFLKEYGEICDTIHVDTVAPVFKGVDYENVVENKELYSTDKYIMNKNVCCSSIFYTLYVLADGRIAPCCDHPQPIIYSDINRETLPEAWNSDIRYKFLVQHLKGKRWDNDICKQCASPVVRRFESDILDGSEEVILKRLNEQRECKQ